MNAREITESRIKDVRTIRSLSKVIVLESITLASLLVALFWLSEKMR